MSAYLKTTSENTSTFTVCHSISEHTSVIKLSDITELCDS